MALRLVPSTPDERPGVVLLRNSTGKQIDNPRSVKAEELAIQLLEARGIKVGAVLDEQGTSGKDLTRRPIAQKLVDQLEAGVWAAVAVIEVSRTSRDPDGVDQRIFKRACRRGKALLLTPTKAYDFRNDSDDLQYEMEAMLAAREWRVLRRRTWEGIVERARIAPVFFGFPPFGYRSASGTFTIRGTTRTVRVLERNPAHAPLMTALGQALDEEDGLAAVAARLNAAGHLQPNGHRWYWSQVERVLKSPLYYGVWEFGTVKQADDLWEELTATPTHEWPELAWYTEDRVKGWRRKCVGKGPIRVRVQSRPHPLLGVLICRFCRRPLISQGARGYDCPSRRDDGCTGQNVSNPLAEGAVRQLLTDVLPNLADLTRRVQAILSAEASPEDLAGEVRALDREISARFEMGVEAKLPGPADARRILRATQGASGSQRRADEATRGHRPRARRAATPARNRRPVHRPRSVPGALRGDDGGRAAYDAGLPVQVDRDRHERRPRE